MKNKDKKLIWISTILCIILTCCIFYSCKNSQYQQTTINKNISEVKPEIATVFNKLQPIDNDTLIKLTSSQVSSEQGASINKLGLYAYSKDGLLPLSDDIPKCTQSSKMLKDFTPAEVMLVFGSQMTVNGKTRYSHSRDWIIMQYLGYYMKNNRPPKNMAELFNLSNDWQLNVKAQIDKNPNLATVFYSAVTHEPLDFTFKEFTPGQMYITPLTLNRGYSNRKIRKSDADPYSIYIRIYGVDKILYESTIVASKSDFIFNR